MEVMCRNKSRNSVTYGAPLSRFSDCATGWTTEGYLFCPRRMHETVVSRKCGDRLEIPLRFRSVGTSSSSGVQQSRCEADCCPYSAEVKCR
jgi:hypothetical protein